MSKKLYRDMGKQAESALKFFVDVYCRSIMVTILLYYFVYIVDSITLQAVKTEQHSILVWGISYLVSFFVISLCKSAERKIEKPIVERKIVTSGEIIVNHFSKCFVWETTYFAAVIFGAMFLRELFPFGIVFEYTSETVGFILCALLTVIIQLIGIVIAIKSKTPKSSYAPWYKISLFACVALILFILFVPSYHGSEPRNMPLFYACIWILIIYFFIRFIIRVARLSQYANKLKLRKARDVKCNYFKMRRKSDISYTMRGERVNVVFLYRIEKLARHYFEDCYTIRRFLRMGIATRGGGGARMSSVAHWTEISEIRLPWGEIKENEEYILVWKKFPTEIADENSRSNTIGNNDLAAGKILILNMDSFKEFISK